MKKVTIITVENQQEGLALVRDVLYKKVNDQTLLLLSGGSTPKGLYRALAKEKKLTVGAVGMVDERIDKSNYRMIKSTGLLDYFESLRINFYPILRTHLKGVRLNPESAAGVYNGTVLKLVKKFKKKVAIMGIGEDGHIAGLPAKSQISSIRQAQDKTQNRVRLGQNYVTEIDNFPGEFRERITLTFKALSEMDLLIILVFGKNKKEALRKMFDPSAGSGQEAIEEIPARFYTSPDIGKKTILITDQKI